MRMRPAFLGLAGAALMATLGGCASVLISGGTEGAIMVAQERSVESAIDDHTIFLEIKGKYANANFEDLFANIEVAVVEGAVLLTGNVAREETQVEAIRLAWTVKNVREVINEIQVGVDAGTINYIKDASIGNQIRARMLATRNVLSINYKVLTLNQVVYLMGIAQNQQELDDVTSIVSRTAGVKRVISYVRLKSDPRRFQSTP